MSDSAPAGARAPTSGAGLRPLLQGGDPPAFRVERPDGASPFLFTCDHAGRQLPAGLGALGLAAAELERHIAWDLGVAELGRQLSARLDAFLILQTYSRLVIDVNRPPGSPESILEVSDGTAIAGNQGLSASDREARAREIFLPYHQRITAELDRRAGAGRPSLLVCLHSFTPCLAGEVRPWQLGVLYGRDTRVGHLLLELLRQDRELVVGDNQPYAVSDQTDHTLLVHGERRQLPHVELELRQDLIASPGQSAVWAERLASVLRRAHQVMFPAGSPAR